MYNFALLSCRPSTSSAYPLGSTSRLPPPLYPPSSTRTRVAAFPLPPPCLPRTGAAAGVRAAPSRTGPSHPTLPYPTHALLCWSRCVIPFPCPRGRVRVHVRVRVRARVCLRIPGFARVSVFSLPSFRRVFELASSFVRIRYTLQSTTARRGRLTATSLHTYVTLPLFPCLNGARMCVCLVFCHFGCRGSWDRVSDTYTISVVCVSD